MKKVNFFATAVLIAMATTATYAQSISSGTGGTVLPNAPTTNLNVGIGTTNPISTLEVTSIPTAGQTAIIGKGLNFGVIGEAFEMTAAPLTQQGIDRGDVEAIGVFGKGTYTTSSGNGNVFGVAGSAVTANPINNIGVLGEARNASGNNVAVIGLNESTTGTHNTGTSGYVALNPSGVWSRAIAGYAPVAPNHFAGYFEGKLAIVDGSQANNYVLTSDVNGLASWTDPSTLSISTTAWGLTGNGATATDFLGTTNAQPLTIKTNNVDRAVVTASGDMGIGTLTPTAKLDVVTTQLTNPAINALGKSVGIYAEATAQESNLIKRSNIYGDLDGIAIFGNAKYTTNTTNGSMYGVVGSATEIAPNNVGVFGEAKNAGGYNHGVIGYVNSPTGVYNSAVAGLVELNTTAIYNRAIWGNAPIAANHFAGYFDGNVEVQTGSLKVGNVAAPVGYKLYVEQGILTEKVKVAVPSSLAWADYVFASDYNLKPLSEVEKFINENKHLPNIPSATALAKDGLDLGKMQALQMEKIEELTLYLIEMKKEIAILQKENSLLKTQNTKN